MKLYDYLEKRANEEGVISLITGAVIKNKDGAILLLKRKADDFMGGYYEIAGGHVDEGEGIYQGLLREVKEETGYNVESVEEYIGYFDYLSNSGKKCRQFNFIVEVNFNDELKLTEHDDYKWVEIGDIESENSVSKEVKDCLMTYAFNKMK